ncbi:hypothetical protein B4U79_16523 [Dinothrombium tinctorium]|uniref:Serpin domain-containing protein n=1 Tax=Dinothrombium tinctorium TaxID=1965070 RepID=A0A3S3P8I5_9ACAR|nr:hypothetical protein B4U79_16523 [Dinothrombium tinctorium]
MQQPQPQPQQPQQIVIAEQNAPQQPEPSPVYMQQPASQPQQPKQIVIARQKTPQPTQPSPIYMQQPTPQPQPQQPQQIVIAEQKAPQQAQPSPVFMKRPAPRAQPRSLQPKQSPKIFKVSSQRSSPQSPSQTVIGDQETPQQTPFYFQQPGTQSQLQPNQPYQEQPVTSRQYPQQSQQPQKIVVVEKQILAKATQSITASPVLIHQPSSHTQKLYQIVTSRKEPLHTTTASPNFTYQHVTHPQKLNQTIISRRETLHTTTSSPHFTHESVTQPQPSQQTVVANHELQQKKQPTSQLILPQSSPHEKPQSHSHRQSVIAIIKQKPKQFSQEQPLPFRQSRPQSLSQIVGTNQEKTQKQPSNSQSLVTQVPTSQQPFYPTRQQSFYPYKVSPLPRARSPQPNFTQNSQHPSPVSQPSSASLSPDREISSLGPVFDNQKINLIFDKSLNIYRVLDGQNDTFVIPKHPYPEGSTRNLSKASKASNRIAFLFYNILQKLFPNVLISPINIMLIFTMFLRSSTGVTANQIFQNLGFQTAGFRNVNDLQTACHSLLDYFDTRYNNVAIPGHHLEFSNRLFFKSDEKVNSHFLSDIEKYFHSTPLGVEFKRGSRHSQRILNDWVLNVTGDKIRSCEVDNEPILPLTRFMASTVSYFYVEIDFKALNTQTKNKNFYNLGRFPILTKYRQFTVNASFITSTNLNADIIEIPLLSINPSMQYTEIYVRPSVGYNTQQIQLTLENFNLVLSELRQSQITTFDLLLPIHNLKQSLRLDRVAPYVGIEALFHPFNAELPFISYFERLHVDKIYQESYFYYTAKNFPDNDNSYPDPNLTLKASARKFTLDRPFIIILLEKYTNTIIYLGDVSTI